ncbi:MAG TPA: hypothetical protein ENL40_02325 [Thermococcus litoralis]|uniref:Uncharacterized protein n=1 Tax=Thermococcus litoralis TaxID=2265 RepID=A0A7C5P1G8_THELI|nr:hypothetical protein [Thermococcus litoralis]
MGDYEVHHSSSSSQSSSHSSSKSSSHSSSPHSSSSQSSSQSSSHSSSSKSSSSSSYSSIFFFLGGCTSITSAPSGGSFISTTKVYKLYQKISSVFIPWFLNSGGFLLFCVFPNVFNILL